MTGALALAVVAAGLHAAWQKLEPHYRYWASHTLFLPASRDFLGEEVDIVAGEIELPKFLQFLADYTGLPVHCDPPRPDSCRLIIMVQKPWTNVTAEDVSSILQENKVRVETLSLASGEKVIRVEVLTPRGVAPTAASKPRGVLEPCCGPPSGDPLARGLTRG